MRQRCLNPNNPAYERYGGRGIAICEQWDEFEDFAEWAYANGYQEDLTIDRIDVNGSYSPDNCRWATDEVQCNNRRNNHYITINGVTKTMNQWCKDVGLEYGLVRDRINVLHWTPEEALEFVAKKKHQIKKKAEKHT